MSSNGEWGRLQDNEAEERYDRFITLPELPRRGEHAVLDRLLASKALTAPELAAIGARLGTWAGEDAIVYFFPDGLKYRVIASGQRASEVGVKWVRAKIVPSTTRENRGVIVAEGETDGAQLHATFPDYDIALLPAGAGNISQTIVAQLKKYDTILVATDNDRAGDEGAAKLMASLPQAKRMVPGEHKDWCELIKEVSRDVTLDDYITEPDKVTYNIFEVINADLGKYEDNHWFDAPILPVHGLAVIHAAKKSGKSFWQLEWLRALTTADTFAGLYQPMKAPAKALLFQFEVLPFDFQNRALMAWAMTPPDKRTLFEQNLFTYHLADGVIPRLTVTPEFIDTIQFAADECGAEILAFDPIQRMTGGADQAKSNEMDPLLDAFAHLQQLGYTVIFSHHNNKAGGKASRDANSMSGTQRFAADPDSLCSIWHDSSAMVPDDNEQMVKQRNVSWELRNGAAAGRSFTMRPDEHNEQQVKLTFDAQLREDTLDEDELGQPNI